MRPMTQLARRAQASMRRPPHARWVAPVRRLGLVLGVIVAVGAAASLVWNSAAVQARLAAARAGLLAGLARQGLVVGDFRIEGNAFTSAEAVSRMLDSYRNQNILLVDSNSIRSRLERLPWVREASVALELPGTLRIGLVEHKPVARWSDGVRWLLVSDAGEIIKVVSSQRFAALPLLLGTNAPERSQDLLSALNSEPDLARQVTYARLVGSRRWNVTLNGRTEVRLPEQELKEAWQRLAAQQRATGLLGRAVKAVDLRHGAWLALELDTATAKEPGA